MLLDVFLGEGLFTKKLVLILLQLRLLLTDTFIHKWLRERWLIRLVVPRFAITYDVNHHILLELCPPITRIRGEANLVIDNDVDRTSCRVGWQGMEAHSFVDNTLAGESRIAV